VSDPGASRAIGGRAAAVLAIVCSAQLILAVDITIILVADVQIKHALGFSEASLSWIVTAYALTFGGLLLLAGRLSDSFGHRRMFLVGMAAFGVASACAALSANPFELVASRAAQGVSAAMVSPAALPVPLGVATGAYTVTRLLRRGRGRPYNTMLTVVGFGLVAAALAWIGAGARTESYATVLLPGWAVLGFGLAVSQVPLAALATSNSSEELRGAVAGVYSMAQQVGTAIGLAAFSVVAVASAHGSALAGRLHGLQVATLGTSALALAAAVLAGLTLPHG
jgi:MFS family permease